MSDKTNNPRGGRSRNAAGGLIIGWTNYVFMYGGFLTFLAGALLLFAIESRNNHLLWAGTLLLVLSVSSWSAMTLVVSGSLARDLFLIICRGSAPESPALPLSNKKDSGAD